MHRPIRTTVLAALLLAAAPAPAHAAVTTFTTLAEWLAAVGGSYSTESFNGFGADASIRGTTVALNGMTVSGTTGSNGSNTQKIDAAPFQFEPDSYTLDGSAYLLGDLEGPSQYIRFDMTAPVAAWSVETHGIGDGRPTTISLYDAANNLLASMLTGSSMVNEKQFYGFLLTGGQQASYVTLVNAGDANDAFGLDNVRYSATTTVPEPGTVALLGAGLLAMAARVRRRATGVRAQQR